MGSEIRIELPMNWYEDDNFLGFALFFYHVPIDDDECQSTADSGINCELISHDNQSKQLYGNWWLHTRCKIYSISGLSYSKVCYDSGSTKDPAILVMYFPRINIPREYRCRSWNIFKAFYHTPIERSSFSCGDATYFKVKSCGIHLIYAQDQNNWPQTSRESSADTKHQRNKKRFFSFQGIMDFLNPSKVCLLYFLFPSD